MSVDKLVDSTQLDADLTSVANAIRTKGGTSASLAFPADFVTAIGNISGGGDVGGLSRFASGTFTVASDYTYTSSAAANYTGSILITTGLDDIKILAVYDEQCVNQTATRPCWCYCVYVSGSICPLVYASGTDIPYHYGPGFGIRATTSNWYQTDGRVGPILNEMTSSVAKGKFGIKTSSSEPLKAGDTIRWMAWGV